MTTLEQLVYAGDEEAIRGLVEEAWREEGFLPPTATDDGDDGFDDLDDEDDEDEDGEDWDDEEEY